MKTELLNNYMRVNFTTNELQHTQSGQVDHLEPRLTLLLKMMLKEKGKVVPREKLIREVWGNYNSGEQLLTHSISQLRKKIGSEVITTVPKSGYMIHVLPERRIRPGSSTIIWTLLLIGFVLIKFLMPIHH